MAESVRCERCGGENPADARFCIECGESLRATTGPTVKLAGVPCPHCRTPNPEQAQFCVVCGQTLKEAPQAPVATPRPRPAYRGMNAPRVAPPALPGRRPVAAPLPPAPRHHRPTSPLVPLVMVVGLLVLLSTHTIWPGILVLIGLGMLMSNSIGGRIERGLLLMALCVGMMMLFSFTSFPPFFFFFMLPILGAAGRCGRRGKHYW